MTTLRLSGELDISGTDEGDTGWYSMQKVRVWEGAILKTGKRRWRTADLSLRGYFMLTIFLTFCTVVLLSGGTIAGCTAFRHYLMPDPDAAYLTVDQVLEDGSASSFTYLLNFGEETKLPDMVAMTVETVTMDEGADTEVQDEQKTDLYTRKTVVHENAVDETYSIRKIESSYDTLTPKRKLAYQLCGAAMVAVPAVLSIGGILFSGFWFYRRRLSHPLRLLSEATEQIAAQNLDFSLEYVCEDEMGALCRSFESMRKELAGNQKAMWEMLEQRKLMQASIAHDLRNPIAIIQGYTEYLQINLPTGKISREKAERIVGNLHMAAKRLEQYTESVRKLNQLEDMEVKREEVSACKFIADIRDDLEIMAKGAGILLQLECHSPGCKLETACPQDTLGRSGTGAPNLEGALPKERMSQTDALRKGRVASEDIRERWGLIPADILSVDKVIVYRLMENIVENAVRFAQHKITVVFTLQKPALEITVTDDGNGFPDEILRRGRKTFLPTGQDGHLGMGLAVSRILCEKHGGSFLFQNAVPHGAIVKIKLEV